MGTAGSVSSGGLIMDEQILAQLLAAMPGNTAQQRLNYFQDLMGELNIDPFGTQQPVIQQWQDPLLKYDITYGGNEGYAAVFDAVDSGVDPETAVRGAVADNRFPNVTDMDEQEKQRFISDAQTVARNYAFEKLDAEQNRMGFERSQAQKAAEAPAPLSAMMPTTAYQQTVERLGFEPTSQDLMDAYSRRLWAGRTRTPVRREQRQVDMPPPPTPLPSGGGVVDAIAGFFRGKPTMGNIVAGVRRSGGDGGEAAPRQVGGGRQFGRQQATLGDIIRRTAPVSEFGQAAPEGFGFGGRYGDVKKQMFEAAAERAAESAKRRTVQTPQSQQFMQNLAYALLLQGD